MIKLNSRYSSDAKKQEKMIKHSKNLSSWWMFCWGRDMFVKGNRPCFPSSTILVCLRAYEFHTTQKLHKSFAGHRWLVIQNQYALSTLIPLAKNVKWFVSRQDFELLSAATCIQYLSNLMLKNWKLKVHTS